MMMMMMMMMMMTMMTMMMMMMMTDERCTILCHHLAFFRSAMQQLPGVDGSTGRVFLRSMVEQLAERQHTQDA